MSFLSQFPGGVVAVDFEFHPLGGVEGNPPEPVCMVVRDLTSGEIRRYWQNDLKLMDKAPFVTDHTGLMVAYYASAELNCFISLGWQLPANVLDLFAEFRRITNGNNPKFGSGLLGALMYFGLPSISSEEKTSMRDLILSRGPWSDSERIAILDYCQTDVDALAQLLPKMESNIDIARALYRGEYMSVAAQIESNGIPIDLPLLEKIVGNWEAIKDQLIARIDNQYGVFVDRKFKRKLFEEYLIRSGISWLRLPDKNGVTGALDLSDDAFKAMSRTYPQILPLRELRNTLSQLRLNELSVGTDGRNRCMLSAFRSITGRNQPSNTKFVFGPSTWIRGFIKPEPGTGLAYIDYSQQEHGIAAAFSKDAKMHVAYKSGDPYLAFAIQAGAVPPNATKHTHPNERDQFKAATLAVQYGMSFKSLAQRINQSDAQAQQLLNLHRRTYKTFWDWSDTCLNEAVLGGKLWTALDWQIHVGSVVNDRSLRNWPMQSTGSEMLRVACILIGRAGVRICAPVHDAILIEAPLGELDDAIKVTQDCMREASRIVLRGFELVTDVKIIRAPDRFMDPRGIATWNIIMELINEQTY